MRARALIPLLLALLFKILTATRGCLILTFESHSCSFLESRAKKRNRIFCLVASCSESEEL